MSSTRRYFLFRQTTIVLLNLAFASRAYAAPTIYLRAQLASPAAADATLQLIQCSFETSGINLELLDNDASAVPLLLLREDQSHVHAQLSRSNSDRTLLGTYALPDMQALCKKLIEVWQDGETGTTPTTNEQMVERTASNWKQLAPLSRESEFPKRESQQSFFKKHWALLTVGTAAATVLTIFLLRQKQDRTSDTIEITTD